MSLRSLKSTQESCTYRLNRAALMRMEEGRRKAMTQEEGYYDNRTICIEVDKRRCSKLNVSQTSSQIENEISKTEEDSALSEEGTYLRTSLRPDRARNKANTSIRSNRPRTTRGDRSKGELSADKKFWSGNRKKTSGTELEKELNATEVSGKRRSKGNRRLRIASAAQSSATPPLGAQAKLGLPRPATSNSSSPSSGQQFIGRTSSGPKRNRTNNRGNVSWASSPPTSYVEEPDRKPKGEKEVTILKPALLGSIMVEPTSAAGTDTKADPALTKRNEYRTSHMILKQPLDESLLSKHQKPNDKLYEYLNESKKQPAASIPREPSLEAIESRESVKKKRKTGSGRSGSRKRSGVMRPGAGTKRLYFKPLTSAATVSSDQEEVISKWRKRLGTSSPPKPSYHNIGSPMIAPSSLRDSQILTVHGTATQAESESYFNPMDMSYLIPERDSPDISIEDIEFQNVLRSMTGNRSRDVFSANEEHELAIRMQMEKTKKHINYLEELAREKVEKLKAIRWKKQRALEEEAMLNDKLENLFHKIQELKESDSFAMLLDKQTQVFATKKTRPYIK